MRACDGERRNEEKRGEMEEKKRKGRREMEK